MSRGSTERMLERATQLALSGRLADAAPLYEDAGRRLLASKRHPEATRVLVAAARARLMLGQAEDARRLLDEVAPAAEKAGAEGQAELAVGRAELADAGGDPEARRAAWRHVADLGGDEARLTALQKLGQLALEANDPATMAAALAEAVDAAERLDDPAALADVLVEHSVALAGLGRGAEASARLDRAEALLRPQDASIRARLVGQRGVVALQTGDREAARAHAVAARAAAVAATDPKAYLAASMLLFMVHEAEGSLVDAYDTLLRARSSLGDLLGKQAEGLVQPAVDTFEARLGPEKLAEVHAAWASRRRAEKGAGSR